MTRNNWLKTAAIHALAVLTFALAAGGRAQAQTPINCDTAVNSVQTGTLTPGDDEGFFGTEIYSDAYSFTVTSSGNVRFELNNDPNLDGRFQSMIQLNRAGGAQSDVNDYIARDNYEIQTTLGPGDYLIRVATLTSSIPPGEGSNNPIYQDYQLGMFCPIIDVDRDSITFLPTDVDGQPAGCNPDGIITQRTEQLVITNLGPINAPTSGTLILNISSLTLENGTIPGDFTIIADTGETMLAQGQTRTLTIQFDPAPPVPPIDRDANIRILSDDPNNGDLSVPLDGVALDSEVEVEPLDIDFGCFDVDDGAAPSQPVTITNLGNTPMRVCSVTLVNNPLGEFIIASDTGEALIPPGGTRTVQVTFDPILPIGLRTGTVLRVVTDDTDETTIDVALTGISGDQEIDVQPLSLVFPDQDVDEGLTATMNVTITNLGNKDLTISDVIRTGADPINFKIVTDTDANGSPTVLIPGATRVIGVAFDPKLPIGPKTAILRITSDDTDEPTVDVTLDGLALDQEIDVAPPALAFGPQDVDAGPTATQDVTISNLGNTDLALASVALAGLNPGDYTIVGNTCGATIAAGGFCTVTIAFNPILPTGPKPAALRIVSDDQDEPTVDVALSGTATDQDIDVDPLALDFGGQDVDAGQTATQPITVTNVGSSDLTISGVSLTAGDLGDFVVVNNPCGVLIPGGSCIIDVAFDPGLPIGTKNATLTILSDDSDEPQVNVALTGVALDQEIDVNPLTLDFGLMDVDAGTTGPLSVFIANLGNAPLNIASVVLGGPASAEYSIAFDSGQAALAAGDTRIVQIAFDPALPTGIKDATLTITSDDTDEPVVVVNITGTAVDQEIDVAPPLGLSFGPQDVDAGPTAGQNVTITNVGSSDLTISSVTLGGANAADFLIGADTGEVTLAPSGSRTVTISFDPSLPTGSKSAQLLVASDDADEPLVAIPLDGTAIDQETEVSALSINFGGQDVDAGATAFALLSITNVGTNDLNISSVALGGPDSAEFPLGPDSGEAVLAPGNTRNVQVAFDPSLPTGAKTATLTINSDDTDEPVIVVDLLGDALDQEIDASAPSLGFGSQDVVAGPTAPQNVQILNLGNTDLNVTSVALAGADAGDFDIVADSGGAVIPPGGSRSVDIVFDPNLPAGAKSASLQVMSDDADEPTFDVPLSGVATNPEIDVAPPSIDFGVRNRVLGATPPVTLTITNLGTTDLALASVMIIGTNQADFAIQSDSGETTLAASAQRFIDVIFLPNLPLGQKSAQLVIASDDFDEPVVIVDLAGETAEGDIEVSPSLIDFGFRDVTDPASEFTTVTIANKGTTDLFISSVGLTGPDLTEFAIGPDSGEMSLSPGTTRTLFLAFDPATTGTKIANLTVVANDPDEPMVDVLLMGSALNDQDVGTSPGALVDFGLVDIDSALPSTQSIVISNDGPTTLTITSVGIIGPDFGLFAITGDTNESALGPGQTRTIDIEFTAALPLGDKLAFLEVVTDDSDESPLNVPLLAVVVDQEIDVAPPSIDFGTRDTTENMIPTVLVTVTNVGSAPLALGAVPAFGGPNMGSFARQNDSGETLLAPGASRTFEVIFLVGVGGPGAKTATLTISSDDTDEPSTVISLDGVVANDGDIQVNPTSFVYADRDVDAGPSGLAVTIRNVGPAMSTVDMIGVSLVGPDAGDFVISGDSGETSLASGAARTLTVSFDPNLPTGLKTAALRVVSDDVSEDTIDIPLEGLALDQEIDVDPPSLTFGSQDVDAGPTASQLVTVTNLGNADLTLGMAASLSGPDFADFTVVSDSGETLLAPGGTRLIEVAFDPALPTGAKSASLDIFSNDADEGVSSVALAGVALDQEIDVAPPGPLAFGDQDVDANQTAAQAVTISNLGNADLNISSVTIVGAQAGEFVIVSDTNEALLGTGAARTVMIAFDPSLPTGAKNAQLRVVSDDTDEPTVLVALTGNAVDQDITVSPLALAFGDQDVDAGATASQSVTITNDGGSTLTLTGIALSGANAGEFAIVGDTAQTTLAPLATRTIDIAFDPALPTGARVASLDISSDDADEPFISVALSGNGVDQEIDVQPTSITFPATDVDAGPAVPMQVTISNVGTATLNLASVALALGSDPDFSILSDSSEAALPPGGVRTVQIGFDPILPGGAKAASLAIVSDDSDETTVTIPISGLALDMEVEVSPLALAFGDQDVDAGATAPQDVTITNQGNSPLNILGFSIVGPNGSDFFVFNDTGDPVLDPAETRTLSIAFDPALPVGAKSAVLRILTDDDDEPTIDVALTGNALDQEITVDPLGPLDFGDQDIDAGPTATQAVTITNDGNSTLTLSNVALAGANASEFTIVSGGGAGILAPSESRTVTIAFNPATVGAKTATLDIASNDTNEALVQIALAGNGTDQEIDVAPLALDFPNIEIEEPPTLSQTVTITNNGSGPLAVTSVSLAGAGAANFLITFDSGEPVLPAGASRIVQVGFDPVAPIGAKSATLDIASDDDNEPSISVALTGVAEQFIDNTLFISHTVPPKMTVGQSLLVGVTALNTGSSTWASGATFLTLIDSKDRSSAVELPEGVAVGPGQAHQFVLQIEAPAEPGAWTLEFQMVEAPDKSFGDTLRIEVQVVEPVNAAEGWEAYE